MRTHLVLVPGFWLGAWAWDEVTPLLRERGYVVTPVTLPGLEDERAAYDEIGLAEHADAIEAAIDAVPGAERTVLVSHSGATVPATMVLDRRPERIAHAVWVDTAPVVDGFILNADMEGESLALSAQWEQELADGSMAGLSEQQLATFRARAVPQPARTVREPVTLRDQRRLAVPGTVVCTTFPASDFRSYAEQGVDFLAGLLEFTALTYVDLPTGHWPMWSRPAELATAIADAEGQA